MRRRDYQAGFSTTVILLAVLVVAVLAVTGVVVYQRHKSSSAKNSAATSTSQTPTQSKSPTTTQPAQANAGLKQYTNDKYGFSFYYPDTWQVEQGDPASAVDAQNTELILWLTDTNATAPKNKTVYIEVNSRNLASETAIIDGSIDSEGGKSADYKQSLTLKGKETVKYTIPQSPTVNRVMYFFAVGTKTYSVQTYDEEANLARTPDYMTKFNNLVDSLTLPQ
jgi:Tfp pilus assembly protein PilV